MISQVTDETLDYVWNALEKQIERALSHGHGDNTTLEEIYQSLKTNRMFMWVIHEAEKVIAGVILSIQIFPNKKTLYVEILAGRDMDSWLPELERTLVEYREIINADTVEASCRIGLAKILSNWGVKAISMELKL